MMPFLAGVGTAALLGIAAAGYVASRIINEWNRR